MPKPDAAKELEHLAGDLHAIAFDFAEPSASVQESDRRIAEVERIAARARAVVRGNLVA